MPKPIRAWMWMLQAVLLLPVAAFAQMRLATPLDEGWHFRKAGDRYWQGIALPHTFNAGDGTDANPYRGPAWYRRTLSLPRQQAGQRRFLEFDGAMLVTEVWVNGHDAGRHAGGFARFRFDITPWLKSGRNQIVV